MDIEELGFYPVVSQTPGDFDHAIMQLYTRNVREFLATLASVELYDYAPLEDELRKLTTRVHGVWPQVQVIPRGSFVSRTALIETADLDVDLVFPKDTALGFDEHPDGTIAEGLGLNDYHGITWDAHRLKLVLQGIYTLLRNHSDEEWLAFRTDTGFDTITRSIPLITPLQLPDLGHRLEVDIFVKVETTINGSAQIVGVDKDGPGGVRRIQTSKKSREGEWIGDRQLDSVDRCAILMLKWWKKRTQLPIKSHHLLMAHICITTAPNADKDLLRPSYEPFSCARLLRVMQMILQFLRTAYTSPFDFLLKRQVGDQEIYDYPIPPVARSERDKLYMQFRQDHIAWTRFTDDTGHDGLDVMRKFEDKLGTSILTLITPISLLENRATVRLWKLLSGMSNRPQNRPKFVRTRALASIFIQA
ncbi:hypothetical protein B0H16DRAFT_1471689 [Mycena metata]|uniref:Uncharacterized protein n=1 Tax=Mycena metata TaxID=1033252 RepID=A0AAD7HQC8_9AGAR|nr:hypothetical protein B0H16DRAFT_1471689 [Mycena metata]